ncbi:MAG: PaaI family thioesterase [Hyphomonadaceae bacterium]|nr:PaaI family thioesterase [Hyphomonadaceae bacterium]
MSEPSKRGPEALLAMTGLEAMRSVIGREGRAPNIGSTMNFRLVEVDVGRAVFEGEPFDGLRNPFGMVHGGWALTLIDSACGCAAHTTLPAGVAYTSIETKVNFVRPIKVDTGVVRAEGRVLAGGRTIITSDATITDSQGKLLAHGTSTLMVLKPQT